jgi:hypothetical protein
MQHKRRIWFLSYLLIAALVLSGCAQRASGGETAAAAGASGIAIDLPALVIDVDAGGQFSVAGSPLADALAMVPQAQGIAGSLSMDPAQVESMTKHNIQHIQIENTPKGLLIWVNGRAMPSLRWDGSVLSGTAETIAALGQGTPIAAAAPMLETLLPMLTNLGFGFIFKFPVGEGVAAIPTHFDEPSESVVAMRAAQEAFVENSGGAPRINLPVYYDVDGRWRVGDLTDDVWVNLTGQSWWTFLRLKPSVVDGLRKANITEMTLSTNAEGIHITLNGNPLPYIGWADGELVNALDLAEQLGLWNTLADQGGSGEMVAMIETLLPAVQASEANFQVYLPGAVAVAR